MTDQKNFDDTNSDQAAKRETTNEGEYTDVETEEGRDTHKDDVTPGEYTDVDLGDGQTR